MVSRFKSFLWILFSIIALTNAQPINISGVVKDCPSNVPIAGAQVRLVSSELRDTTHEDGTFSLKSPVTSALSNNEHGLAVAPACNRHGIMTFGVSSKEILTVHTYTLRGQLVGQIRKTVEAGMHSILLPRPSKGRLIHRVSLGAAFYTYTTLGIEERTAFGAGATKQNGTPLQTGQAKSTEETFLDTLVVTQQDVEISRIVVTSSSMNSIVVQRACYTVTYNGNGNTDGARPESQTKAHGMALTLAINSGNLARTGHTFVGWNTAANGSGTNHAEGSSYKTNANETMYAKWKVIGIIAGPTVTDADGNAYTSVVLGTQIWTVENLRTTKYNDGSPIPHVTDAMVWSGLTTPAYCWYNNRTDLAMQEKWGALYNWHVIDPNNSKKIAPDGWRVPTYEEWASLENSLWDGTTTSNFKIAKALAAQTDWPITNTGGGPGHDLASNNSSGFSALPGGHRDSDGQFKYQRLNGYWCTTTASGASDAVYRYINNYLNYLTGGRRDMRFGASVRLVRDLVAISSCTISYEGNGNTGGTVPELQTKWQGVALPLAPNSGNLVRMGYTFAGWNTKADGSGTDYAAGTSYTSDSAITLYAKWTALLQYTISYDGNDNTGGTAPPLQTKTQGVPITLATNSGTLARTGYTFDGWNTAANGSGADYAEKAIFAVDTAVTLYAKWGATEIVVGPTVTDADGNVYTSIVIGTQIWTAENLRTTKYNDGSEIPHVTGAAAWNMLATPGYCHYNNATNPDTIKKWGALYNWYAVNTGKLAPDGWRVPSDGDWTTLENYLIVNRYNYDSTTSENKVAKAMAAQSDWTASTILGAPGNGLRKNNASGFTAIPGGYRYYGGIFNHQGGTGTWWSATENDDSRAYNRTLHYYQSGLTRTIDYYKNGGNSVRLLRDLN